METKIKTKAYIAKLKRRLAQLKTRRERDIAKYKQAVSVWKTDMEAWLGRNARLRLVGIGIQELRKHQPRYEHDKGRVRFSTVEFFKGAPEPPVYPSDALIREITRLIGLLSLSQQDMVAISGVDIERMFSDEKPDSIEDSGE